MKILALKIVGFRGVRNLDIKFQDKNVLVGANGVGKSTIIDAISLAFGRNRLVRELTEHDFYASNPGPADRIKIVATLAGFSTNDPADHTTWFRSGRGVPVWWNKETRSVSPEPPTGDSDLCVQIGLAARFDRESLSVEQIRYFHDDESQEDAFVEEAVQLFPPQLLNEIGFYVLPAQRTWESSASFGSELFRKAVMSTGGLPAQNVIDERDRLRNPENPLEGDAGLATLTERINSQLAKLLPTAPSFQLRVTATDSNSLLRALVPHYQFTGNSSLPANRQGTGLLSLQTFVLLLEVGRRRQAEGKSFILATEEPELHIPPGLQRRLIAQAAAVSNQIISTSHSPRLASFFPATSVIVLEQRGDALAATPMLNAPLPGTASNTARKIYNEDRGRVIEALMHSKVIIPEGRTEYEWIRLLSDVTETGDEGVAAGEADEPPLSVLAGVIPTQSSAVVETYRLLRPLRNGLVPLVDGDGPGKAMIDQLKTETPPPELILRWPDDQVLEDAIVWILEGNTATTLPDIQARLLGHEYQIADMDDLRAKLRINQGQGRLKTNYLACEEIAAAIAACPEAVDRAKTLLNTLSLACQAKVGAGLHLEIDAVNSIAGCQVIQINL